MTAPVTPAQLRERARRRMERDGPAWAASGEADTTLDIALHPPSEREALAGLDAARAWVQQWRTADEDPDIRVEWSVRRWSRVGSQQVPVRATVHGADALARLAGLDPQWRILVERLAALRAMAGPGAQSVLRPHARTVAALTPGDFRRLVEVLSWLREHPASGRRVRELPIRGVDTKWIEARRGLVESLYSIVTGATGLGLLEPEPSLRLRVLDPRLALAGLTDVSAPVGDLAGLALRPDRVYVVENLATVLAMPPIDGAVVIHGAGHRAALIAQLPWAHRVRYWGDLDTHGFAILHHLRARGVSATSFLMDDATLLAHRDLWVTEPEPNIAVLEHLTPAETETLHLLGVEGNVRLEQERIPWSFALSELGSAT